MGAKHSKEPLPPTEATIAGSHIDTATTSSDSSKIDSNYSKPVPGTIPVLGECPDIIETIGKNLPSENRVDYGATNSLHREFLFGTYDERTLKITRKLLSAVAYGMESKTANIPMRPSDAAGLFNPDLFAEDLLKQSPEFLLEKGDITDWGGRTFKHITAFEYALWAKDFKMIEMMLSCIPKTSEGDEIRAALLKQYNQVKAPISACGGLTYTLTYDRPNLDAFRRPIENEEGNWQTTSVTKVYTENHFDVTPLLMAYQDNINNYCVFTAEHHDPIWIKVIGTLQRLLPIHLLQRYCSPDTPFSPLPKFTGDFKRTTQFYNSCSYSCRMESLLSSSLSTDFSLFKREDCPPVGRYRVAFTLADFLAVQHLDKVSTNEIEINIKQQLMSSAPSQTQLRT